MLRHIEFRQEKFGLMEGLSGTICFLSDLLRDDDTAVSFPGFEINTDQPHEVTLKVPTHKA